MWLGDLFDNNLNMGVLSKNKNLFLYLLFFFDCNSFLCWCYPCECKQKMNWPFSAILWAKWLPSLSIYMCLTTVFAVSLYQLIDVNVTSVKWLCLCCLSLVADITSIEHNYIPMAMLLGLEKPPDEILWSHIQKPLLQLQKQTKKGKVINTYIPSEHTFVLFYAIGTIFHYEELSHFHVPFVELIMCNVGGLSAPFCQDDVCTCSHLLLMERQFCCLIQTCSWKKTNHIGAAQYVYRALCKPP